MKTYKHTRLQTRILVALALISGAILTNVSSAHAASGPTPVYRLYNKTAIQHLMTNDANESTTLLGNPSWAAETSTFKANAPVSGACQNGTEPVYRIVEKKSGEHLLTADTNEVNHWTVVNNTWYTEAVGFCVYSTQVNGTSPVYRVYNSQNGEHLLTSDTNEVNTLNGHYNWRLEANGNNGIVFYANI